MDSLRIFTAGLALLAIVLLSCPSSGQDRRSAEVAGNGTAVADQTIALPVPRLSGSVSLEETLAARRSVRSFADEPLTLAQAGQLLWAAQGITDSRLSYRTAPSAGARFPLEAYLAAGEVEGLEPGLYLYLPQQHALLPVIAADVRSDLRAAAYDQAMLTNAPALICLAGVNSRTAAKYGAKAPRYVAMEAGHSGQSVLLQAVALGLAGVPVGGFEDTAVKAALRLPAEQEPLYLLAVGQRAD